MEYFEFNKTMERGDAAELLRCAGNCKTRQWEIEEQIADLQAKLHEQKNFESKLRKKAQAF